MSAGLYHGVSFIEYYDGAYINGTVMTEAGIVGAHKGSKAREVLLTLEDWEEMNGAPMEQGVGDE